MHESSPPVPADFVLFEGGPFDQFWQHWRLAMPLVESLERRVVVISTVAWLPLLLLSLVGGLAFTGVPVPFLYDVQAQSRFLVALPLLLVAERVAHRVLTPSLALFWERGIIRTGDRARFTAILASASRWNHSLILRILLLAIVLVVGHRIWLEESMIRTATWYGESTASGLKLTLPGYWYAWVAIPIFQFVQVRWYCRMVLWGILLARVSRLDLHLVATHPDRSGGLGFLGTKLYAFVPLLFGLGAFFSGFLLNRILHDEGRLLTFWPEIVAQVGFTLVLVLGPLAVFLPRLIAAKRQGKSEYGHVANRYVREFEDKWVRGGVPAGETLVGSADVQSLADMGNSYDIVTRMRPLPFGRDEILLVIGAIVLPMLPLLLTVFSVQEILQTLLHMIL